MEVKDALGSQTALAAFVAEWRGLTLPAKAWTHGAHIMVAAWLLTQLPEAEAREAMRRTIPRYNEATGGVNTTDSGYHETLTCFWMAKLSAFFRRRPAEETAIEKVRLAVEHFGQRRDWHTEHYSFDVVKSREARARWIEPDLAPVE